MPQTSRQLISTLLEFKLLSHVYIAITARAGTRDSMGTLCTRVEIMINNNNNNTKHRKNKLAINIPDLRECLCPVGVMGILNWRGFRNNGNERRRQI